MTKPQIREDKYSHPGETSTGVGRTVSKVTLLSERESFQAQPTVQVHAPEKDRSEMCFQKGRLAAETLCEKGMISKAEKVGIIRFFCGVCNPDIADVIDL